MAATGNTTPRRPFAAAEPPQPWANGAIDTPWKQSVGAGDAGIAESRLGRQVQGSIRFSEDKQAHSATSLPPAPVPLAHDPTPWPAIQPVDRPTAAQPPTTACKPLSLACRCQGTAGLRIQASLSIWIDATFKIETGASYETSWLPVARDRHLVGQNAQTQCREVPAHKVVDTRTPPQPAVVRRPPTTAQPRAQFHPQPGFDTAPAKRRS